MENRVGAAENRLLRESGRVQSGSCAVRPVPAANTAPCIMPFAHEHMDSSCRTRMTKTSYQGSCISISTTPAIDKFKTKCLKLQCLHLVSCYFSSL